MRKKTAIICGPFYNRDKSKVLRNIKNAEIVAYTWWKNNYDVICPHTNSGFMYGLDVDEGRFLEFYKSLIISLSHSRPKAELLLVTIPGYEISAGSMGEIALCMTLSIPIHYTSHEEFAKAREAYWKIQITPKG